VRTLYLYFSFFNNNIVHNNNIAQNNGVKERGDYFSSRLEVVIKRLNEITKNTPK